MTNEKNKPSKIEGLGEEYTLSSGDLKYILDVNKKAIEINIEVEKQNEQVQNTLDEIKEKINHIDKNLFRLVVLLSSAGAGILFTVIQSYIHK